MRKATMFGYAVYLLLGWSSVLIPSLIVSIEDAFGRSDADIGVVYLVGALLHAGGALAGGVLGERTGARLMLLLALFTLTAGLCVQGWTSSWVLFVVAAGVGQIGFGAANGGVQALFLGLFTEERGGALNLLHLMFGVGALLGPAAVSIVLATDADWRLVFIASGAICLGLTTAVLTLPQIDLTSTQSPGEPSSTAPILDSERSLSPFIWLAVSIACYEATAIGVASWLVRFLSDESTTVATGALSLFWAGVCAVRLAAPWITRRVAATPLTLACIAGSSLTLAGAIVVPWTPAAVVLFGLTGVGIGPIYPLIIAIGGDLYPRRLAALSGGLTTAATVGAIIYPPLIGFIAGTAGIRAGLLGAAALGIPAALALLAATRPRPGAFPTAGERPNPCGFH